MGKRKRRRPSTTGGSAATKPRAQSKARPTPRPEDFDDSLVGRAKASWRMTSAPTVERGGGKPRVTRTAGAKGAAGAGRTRRPSAVRERPPALWGKAPISELLILVGVGFIAASVLGGPGGSSRVLLLVGLTFAGVASFEFAAREHMFGLRSHSLFLALIPTAIMHAAVYAIAGREAAASGILFAADVIVFGLLATVLMRQFRNARADREGA